MFDLTKLRSCRNNQTGWVRMFALVIVIWSALVAGSLAWYMHLQQQSVLNTATAAARANINKDQSFRKWAATHGGVYVPPTEHTPPNPYLKVPDRDVVTTTGKTLTLMNPAYMLRQLQSDFPGDYGTRSHITSLNPINPNNAPDVWEAKALHAFDQGGKELLETQQIDGQPYLRMMLPLVVEQGCLKCHAQQGYKLGDIRGGVSTAVPLAPFLALERKITNDLRLSHGAIWLLGLAGLVGLGVLFRRVERMEILAHSAAAIEKSERRFRAVAESANDAIINADSVGKVVEWNLSAERLFGYTKAEIIGQPLTVLMPERFRNLHSEGLARVVAGGTPHVIGKTVELAGLHKDGSEFPLEFSLAQWQAAEGQFFTAIIRDITERKRAEQALLQSEADLKTLVEHSPIAMIVDVGVDEDEKIMMMNQKFTELFGYTLEDVPDVRHWWPLAYPDEKYREELMAEWTGKVEKSIQSHGGIEPMETTVTCKDGTIRQVRISLASIGSRNIVTFEDFTEHKRIKFDLGVHRSELEMQNEELRQAQIAMEESRDQFVDLYEFSPVGYLTLGHEEMIDKINLTGATLLGAERNKLLHHRFAPFVATEDRDRWHRHFFNILQHDGSQRCELALRRSDDSVFHAQLDCLHVKAGGASSVRIVLTDITERKQAEAQLAEQLDELRRWHEITSDREIRILDIKHEVNELLVQAGQPPRYPSVESDDKQEK